MAEQEQTRDIICNCHEWLAQITVTLGQRQVLRLRRCPECRRRGLPSTPIVFVREDGRYLVVSWYGRVSPDMLPWPETEEGWRR